MRMQMTRDFYLPRESQGRTNIEMITAEDAVIYTYGTARGQLGAMAFHGKAAKPDWHYSFANEVQRQKRIADYIEGRKGHAATIAERKAKRKEPHSLTVGTILVCSWGYDQTNIDFYQVTRVPSPNSVEIRAIAASSGPEIGFMTAYCSAVRDKFMGEPMIKRADKGNSVRISSYSWAHPWDGKPDRYSWYA